MHSTRRSVKRLPVPVYVCRYNKHWVDTLLYVRSVAYKCDSSTHGASSSSPKYKVFSPEPKSALRTEERDALSHNAATIIFAFLSAHWGLEPTRMPKVMRARRRSHCAKRQTI